MNDVAAKERWTERMGADLRLRFIPFRPTSILRREIVAAIPFAGIALFPTLLAYLVYNLLERTNAKDVGMVLVFFAREFGIVGLGLLCGSTVLRRGRADLTRTLPISSRRVAVLKFYASLVVLVVWVLLVKFLVLLGTIIFSSLEGGELDPVKFFVNDPFWVIVQSLLPFSVAVAVSARFGRSMLLSFVLTEILYNGLHAPLALFMEWIDSAEWYGPSLQRVFIVLYTLGWCVIALEAFAYRYRTCEAAPS